MNLVTMRAARAAGALGEEILDHGLTLKNASNENMDIYAVFWLTMYISGQKIIEPVVVLRKLSGSMIIGQNVIKKHGLTFNPVLRKFDFIKPKLAQITWTKGHLTAVSGFVIKARSARLVRAHLVHEGTRIPIQPHQAFVGSVCGSPIAHATDANGICRFYLTNPLDEDMDVARGCCIGTAEPEELFDFDSSTLDKSALNAICAIADENRTKPSLPAGTISKTKLKMIHTAVARSTMPAKWRPHFITLLTRYHSTISETPDDLGHCKTVIHDITLRSEEPCYSKQFSLPAHELQVIKDHVKSWLAAG